MDTKIVDAKSAFDDRLKNNYLRIVVDYLSEYQDTICLSSTETKRFLDDYKLGENEVEKLIGKEIRAYYFGNFIKGISPMRNLNPKLRREEIYGIYGLQEALETTIFEAHVKFDERFQDKCMRVELDAPLDYKRILQLNPDNTLKFMEIFGGKGQTNYIGMEITGYYCDKKLCGIA